MNENNEYYEENETKHHHHDHYDGECYRRKHSWFSRLLTALLTLLGAFLAFYVVTDWHYKRLLDPAHQMRKMERMMMKEDRAMQKMMHRDFRTERNLEGYIQLDETPNAYIITVNLKPFDNDTDNVKISTDDNIVTVQAMNEKSKRNDSKVLAVSQSYAFPSNVNLNKMTKERKGDKYLITIPMNG